MQHHDVSAGTALDAAAPRALTTSDQDAAMSAYVEAFYTVTDGAGNFVLDTVSRAYPQEIDFWRMAEEIEMVEDAYDRTHDPRYKTMVEELYAGFVKVHGANWLGNIYNDDLMWITIACLRAYKITGKDAYLKQARQCFDATWNRAYDPTDGGVWWTTDNTSKNACVNGPTAIAAVLLFQCGAGAEYLERAKTVFGWEVKTLYHSDGRVCDNITAEGVIHDVALSYNQGTFIGAAHLLNQTTGTKDYEQYAITATAFTRDHCSGENAPGIIRNEYTIGQGNSDNAGFKGIFARWCGLWVRESGNTEFLPWLHLNARTVFDNRNSAGLSWGVWGKRTPDDLVAAWECSSAIAMIQNVPPSE